MVGEFACALRQVLSRSSESWTDQRRFRACLLRLPARRAAGGDFVHVFFVSQQGGLRNPDGFPCRLMRHRKFAFQECMLFFGLLATEAIPVLAIAEHVQLMQ